MNQQNYYWPGVLCVVFYVLIAATQSVALNIFLYGVNLFMVVGWSFLIATLLFFVIGIYTRPDAYTIIFSQWRLLLLLNVVSMVNWLFYFMAVKYLDPAVAVTLIQGLGPVSMSIYYWAKRQFVSRVTKVCHAVIFIAAVCMCYYIIYFKSAHSLYSRNELVIGIVIAVLCSVSIVLTILISKRFSIGNVPVVVLLSLRFPLLIIVCLSALEFQGSMDLHADIVMAILLIALLGVGVSSYFFQKGIELASPLTVSTVLGLSPLLVFLIQLLNANIPFSPVLLALIVVIVAASLLVIFYDARRLGRAR